MSLKRVANFFGLALRETGQAMDRFGCDVASTHPYLENFARHRSILSIFDRRPVVDTNCFIAPNATVAGYVSIGHGSSVFYGTVIRGDINHVKIGTNTNIQDRVVIKNVVDAPFKTLPPDTMIGNDCTIGHGAILSSCVVGNNCLIGQGAVLEPGAFINPNSIVAAGSVVTSGTMIPAGQLWAGNPAVFVRDLTHGEIEGNKQSAAHYVNLANDHDQAFAPFNTVHWDAEKKGLL